MPIGSGLAPRRPSRPGLGRQQGVDLVDDLAKPGAFGGARPRQRDRDLARMRPGSLLKIRMRSAISTASSMLCETMTIPLVGMRRCVPQIEEIAAQGFGGQHVERRERLVEQQDVRVDDERAGKADALPHAAGQLLRIGVLEPVEPDQVDRARPRAAAARRRRRPAPRGRARHCRARSATETAHSSGTPSRCRGPAR